jgi:hypothetical protein
MLSAGKKSGCSGKEEDLCPLPVVTIFAELFRLRNYEPLAHVFSSDHPLKY